MKSKFSTAWQSSSQPRKQRKFNYNAPLHIMHKFLSANLSKSLREKHGKRNLPLRKGDEVLVMRGFFRKKKAKVTSVNLKQGLAVLEGIQRTKKDGSKVNVYFHPSKLQIINLDLSDKTRVESLNRKSTPKTIKNQKQEKGKESETKKKSENKSLNKKENKNAPN